MARLGCYHLARTTEDRCGEAVPHKQPLQGSQVFKLNKIQKKNEQKQYTSVAKWRHTQSFTQDTYT